MLPKGERYANGIEIVNKNNIIQFFNTYIFPHPTKLTILLHSQRIPSENLAPLLDLIPTSHFDEAKNLIDSKPTLEQVRSLVHKVAPNDALLAAAVKELSTPAPLDPGVQEIFDVEAFKLGLDLGPPVIAVNDFSRGSS